MALLLIHACAGVLWATPGQVLLYDIVGPAELPSGVRLNATSRYLGTLVGPAVGSAILLAFGPAYGMLLNTIFYLPAVLWLVNAPYGPRFRKGAAPSSSASARRPLKLRKTDYCRDDISSGALRKQVSVLESTTRKRLTPLSRPRANKGAAALVIDLLK